MESEYAQSSNINAKWLENIYENIKHLEDHERLAREGCRTVLEFVQIPANTREIVLGETQFKNIKLFVNEFSLLLSDLSPVIEEKKLEEFRNAIDAVEKGFSDEAKFIKRIRNAQRQVIRVELTGFFHKTLRFLADLKVKLFIEIKGILYISPNRKIEAISKIT